MIDKQFTLYVENKAGVLARLTGEMAKAKINIQGISVAESTDVAIVQIVVDRAQAAAAVLKKLKIAFTLQSVALVEMDNEPGALAKIISKITRTGVNINYIYATGCSCASKCSCYAVIGAPDLKKVEAAWKQASGKKSR